MISTSPLTQIPHQTNATIEKVIKSLGLQVPNGPSNSTTSTPLPVTNNTEFSGPIKTSTPLQIRVENIEIPIKNNYSINLIVLGGVIIGASMVCTIAGVCIKRAINMSRVAHANDSERDIEMQAKCKQSIINKNRRGAKQSIFNKNRRGAKQSIFNKNRRGAKQSIFNKR